MQEETMTAHRNSEYRHTQRAPLCLLLYFFGLVFLLTAFSARAEPVWMWLFVMAGMSLLVLGAAFHHLSVEDQGSRLSIRFGPLPLFSRRIPYDWILSAQPGRTTLLDGLGIHWSFHGGWTWNLWGTECVVLRLRTGTLRIGSNDVPRLIAFLNRKISASTLDI